MTTQTDALPACPHGNEAVLDRGTSLSGRPSHRIRTLGACDCRVFSGDEQSARAAWTALCAPHALAASRAEVERLRKAAANVAAMYQTDPLTTVDGLTDTDFIMRISALRAALAAQGGGT